MIYVREAYERGQEFLRTRMPEHPKEEDLKRMFRAELLRMGGYSEEEIEKGGLLELSEEEFRTMLQERLLGGRPNNPNSQRVISLEDIEKYIEEGWEYVTTLPNNKAVLRLPS